MRRIIRFSNISFWWIPWIIIGFIMTSSLAPASWWFEVESVRISDAKIGQIPAMFVKRTIHNEFEAEWVVSIRKKLPSGGFYSFCTNTGRTNYKPGAVFPSNLNFEWWTSSDPTAQNSCVHLLKESPGEYLAITTWKINNPHINIFGVPMFPSLTDKQITYTSNIFRIFLKDELSHLLPG